MNGIVFAPLCISRNCQMCCALCYTVCRMSRPRFLSCCATRRWLHLDFRAEQLKTQKSAAISYPKAQRYADMFIVCSIAIAYGMGQIKFSLYLSMLVAVCRTLTVAFLDRFSLKWNRSNNPQKYERVCWDQHCIIPSPPKKTAILGQRVLKIHANINKPISALTVRLSIRKTLNVCAWGDKVPPCSVSNILDN